MLPQPENAEADAAGEDVSSLKSCGGDRGFLILPKLQSREEDVESESFLYEIELPRDPEPGPARRRNPAL